MAGHDLLPGCQVPWKHDDCPGYVPAEAPPVRPRGQEEFRTGGLVCHCPHHGMQREIDELRARVNELEHHLRYQHGCVELVETWFEDAARQVAKDVPE